MWHAKLTRQGEGVDGGGKWRVSPVDKVVKVTRHSSLESVHHYFHLFLYRLHLRDDRWRSRIHKRGKAHVPSLWSAWGVVSLWSFLVPPFSAGSFLIRSLVIWCCVFLVQLLLQVAVLFGEVLHSCGERPHLLLKCSHGGFFFLNVVSGCH